MARILVVDDDPAVLATVRTLLEMGGHGVVTAGQSASHPKQIYSGQVRHLVVDEQPAVGAAGRFPRVAGSGRV